MNDEIKEAKLESGPASTDILPANEEYGVEILKVQEIIGRMPITPVPRTPSYIRGVINLRAGSTHHGPQGQVQHGATEITDETCIIVIKTAAS